MNPYVTTNIVSEPDDDDPTAFFPSPEDLKTKGKTSKNNDTTAAAGKRKKSANENTTNINSNSNVTTKQTSVRKRQRVNSNRMEQHTAWKKMLFDSSTPTEKSYDVPQIRIPSRATSTTSAKTPHAWGVDGEKVHFTVPSEMLTQARAGFRNTFPEEHLPKILDDINDVVQNPEKTRETLRIFQQRPPFTGPIHRKEVSKVALYILKHLENFRQVMNSPLARFLNVVQAASNTDLNDLLTSPLPGFTAEKMQRLFKQHFPETTWTMKPTITPPPSAPSAPPVFGSRSKVRSGVRTRKGKRPMKKEPKSSASSTRSGSDTSDHDGDDDEDEDDVDATTKVDPSRSRSRSEPPPPPTTTTTTILSKSSPEIDESVGLFIESEKLDPQLKGPILDYFSAVRMLGTLEWMSVPSVTGIIMVSQHLDGFMNIAYDSIMERFPQMAGATIEDFVRDNNVHVKFAKIIAILMNNAKFNAPYSGQRVIETYKLPAEYEAEMRQLSLYDFDRWTQTFSRREGFQNDLLSQSTHYRNYEDSSGFNANITNDADLAIFQAQTFLKPHRVIYPSGHVSYAPQKFLGPGQGRSFFRP